MKYQKPWFSLWNYPQPYEGNEPEFWDDAVFLGLQDFEVQMKEILVEVHSALEKKAAAPYFKTEMVSGGEGYDTLSLKWWGIQFFKNAKEFPILQSLLDKYPDIITLSINVLEPGKRIFPHMGDTNAVFRCHFGIDIPERLPHCGIRVKDEVRSWKTGGWIVFTDAYSHETWNRSAKPRIILLMDVIRPEFMPQQKRIQATVLCSLFLQKRMVKYPWVQKNIRWLVPFLSPPLIPLIALRIEWLNFIRKY
jgi:hypothetical protein